MWAQLLKHTSESFLSIALSSLDSDPREAKRVISPHATSLSLPCPAVPIPSDLFVSPALGCVSSVHLGYIGTLHGKEEDSLLPAVAKSAWEAAWPGQTPPLLHALRLPSLCSSIVWLVRRRWSVRETTQIFRGRALQLPAMRASGICRQLNLSGPRTGVLPRFALRLCTENGRHLVKAGFVCAGCHHWMSAGNRAPHGHSLTPPCPRWDGENWEKPCDLR